MFDKLEGLVDRLDTVLQELNDPDVASNQNRFRDLMKEQNELAPIVEKYKEYKEAGPYQSDPGLCYGRWIFVDDWWLSYFFWC